MASELSSPFRSRRGTNNLKVSRRVAVAQELERYKEYKSMDNRFAFDFSPDGAHPFDFRHRGLGVNGVRLDSHDAYSLMVTRRRARLNATDGVVRIQCAHLYQFGEF
jgi:hypothetical protein